jgi:RNase P subunit RPR2
MIQEAGAIRERMHILLLRRWLRRGCKKVRDFFDAFCEVELRLLS